MGIGIGYWLFGYLVWNMGLGKGYRVWAMDIGCGEFCLEYGI